ncbi:putative tetratricopeptide-like helical domain superfamily [Helianthus annuus]|nr:putative tetratricopeptide-like helical domain superfamily [Helianthus annuus]
MFVIRRVWIPLGSMQFTVELTGFKYRHDLVRDVLFDIFRCAGISAKKETPVNFLTDPLEGRSTLRPADILVFGWVGGKHACVDLTGVSPLVGLGGSAFTVGQAASGKVTKHEKACLDNQHVFIPFAFDTFVFLTPEAVELLSRVQRAMHSNVMTPRSMDVVFKRLSFAIQKGVRRSLLPVYQLSRCKLVEKDPDGAIVMFWKAINAGDRVDSALKDMAVVMKQQDRAEEAIELIRSFRDRCSKQAQESLDNVLIDLYKKCGKIEEQIELLKQKLRMIYQGETFNGKPTKTARSHGRKFQVTIKQETSRILGNLGWAYLQLKNFAAAEAVYRKAQEIDPDANKACNMCLCLVKQGRYEEANAILKDVLEGRILGSNDPKLLNRTKELVQELEPWRLAQVQPEPTHGLVTLEDAFIEGLDQLINQWTPLRSRRLPVFEEISTYRDQLAC